MDVVVSLLEADMVVYKIFGKTVQPHMLAIATLLGCVGGISLVRLTSRSRKKQIDLKDVTSERIDNMVDINAEQVIEDFLKEYDIKNKKKE